ncbi:MAG: EFR1 family ferrodoxin [Prevotellaceae bacterium]|nr:EFR1 family ferrodoxin [Prevotellaceae bacterium]
MTTDKGMSRRDALKVLGSAALGMAIATSGVSSLASCAEKRHKRIILYFTGTGNCLYIARQLATEDTELLSIPQLMKEKRFNLEAEEIGLVYPIYGHMPPNMVRKFIKKAKLNAGYKFAVLTYGMRKCNAVEIWDEISRKAGCKFDYISTLIMVDNWLPNFDMNEQMKIDKHIPESLQRINADLGKQRRWHEPVTEEERMNHQGFMERAQLDPEVGFLMKSEKYFAIEDSCIGCGICTYVCPQGNYQLTSQGVKTQGDCEFCFACIHNCPQKAIQFAKNDEDPLLRNGEKNPNARYRNENVSLYDLKCANNQF